jgi:hypothetical protein
MPSFALVGILLGVSAAAQGGLIDDIRTQLAQNSFSAAESELRTYKAQHGVTPEYLKALSWMARGAAAEKPWGQALWKYIHSSAPAEESQSAGSGW